MVSFYENIMNLKKKKNVFFDFLTSLQANQVLVYNSEMILMLDHPPNLWNIVFLEKIIANYINLHHIVSKPPAISEWKKHKWWELKKALSAANWKEYTTKLWRIELTLSLY